MLLALYLSFISLTMRPEPLAPTEEDQTVYLIRLMYAREDGSPEVAFWLLEPPTGDEAPHGLLEIETNRYRISRLFLASYSDELMYCCEMGAADYQTGPQADSLRRYQSSRYRNAYNALCGQRVCMGNINHPLGHEIPADCGDLRCSLTVFLAEADYCRCTPATGRRFSAYAEQALFLRGISRFRKLKSGERNWWKKQGAALLQHPLIAEVLNP